MSGGIYLIRDDGELVEMNERSYDTEDLLQGYLARHHDLLAGDQIDNAAPRRWVLVSREMPLASEEDGAGRWSVDHLFLDQDAIPTIVEVKRSTDTRIRREVVGQMLDYAANAVVYWPVERLRAQFEANTEAEQSISDLLEDPDSDPEDFWQKVKANLQVGRVRLIFVSDKILDELRRIVEFLNEQMNPTEVLALEIKQYVSRDSNLRTLVPRIIGQTAKAQNNKSGGTRSGRQWDKDSFFRELGVQLPGAVGPAKELLERATGKVSRVVWGKGKQYGTFSLALDHKGTELRPIQAWTDGHVYIQLGAMRAGPPFNDRTKRLEAVRPLNKVPGVGIPEESADKNPGIALAALDNEAALGQFLEVLDWMVLQIKASQPGRI